MYYATKSRPPCARAVRDAVVIERIKDVHSQNYGVYGVRKVHAEIGRTDGVDHRMVARCTVASPSHRRLAGLHRPADRPGPGRSEHGPVDPNPRRAGRQQPGPSLRPWRAVRGRPVHQRLAEGGAVASVGSKGDSYDNAMAEALNSLFKAELIRSKGPWHDIDGLEIAIAEYIDWYNHRRLHGQLGLIPPVEYETSHHHTAAPVSVTSG